MIRKDNIEKKPYNVYNQSSTLQKLFVRTKALLWNYINVMLHLTFLSVLIFCNGVTNKKIEIAIFCFSSFYQEYALHRISHYANM